jgi:hypothetical protein
LWEDVFENEEPRTRRRRTLMQTRNVNDDRPVITPVVREEKRFRELADRFIREADPKEQDRLKTELVRWLVLRRKQVRVL